MADTNEGPVFRASKRRKVFRKRRDDDETSDGDVATPTGSETVADSKQYLEVEAGTREGSVFLSHVRPLSSRKGGVAFSSSRNTNDSGSNSVVDTNAPPTPLNAVEHAQARFVAPTGHIASADDKHMCVALLFLRFDKLQKRLTVQGMAYVDSKLARLTPSHEAATQPSTLAESTTTSGAIAQQHVNQSSASHGHLHQVDVPKPVPTATTTRSQKPPRKPHWRNRRNSADLARDAMVDKILAESQLNIYEPSASATHSKAPADDTQDADERMAEEFKRNFYAAAEERAVRRTAAPPPPTFGANKLESIKGPKLGGSRSQRAAMHAAEKAKTAKK
ncbi:unnamed protein product [Aureobasidium uvarum]|uniref:Uncharacterized protein n=1 Tax=Aureobasidium uvarum TaxID=2773716 RepID=A0A9N8KG65_9PEZI|nr:unnamed protein product [Aureobasidium uvarum]